MNIVTSEGFAVDDGLAAAGVTTVVTAYNYGHHATSHHRRRAGRATRGGTKRENLMKLGTAFAIQAFFLGIGLAITAACFDYCLQNVLGKDIAWYGDVIAGAFAAPVTVPLAVVIWVLKLCGVGMPLIS